MADWRWYITLTAVREWMAATGRSGPLEDTNQDFCDAEDELGMLSLTANLSEAATAKESGDSLVYRGRVMVKGKSVRAECYVRATPRKEGDLPQLVRVRRK